MGTTEEQQHSLGDSPQSCRRAPCLGWQHPCTAQAPLQRDRSSHLLKHARAHKERLSCSILEQKQELHREQQTRGRQRKLQQGKSQQVIKISISHSLLCCAKEQSKVNSLFQVSKHSPSQQEATNCCQQLPHSKVLETMGKRGGAPAPFKAFTAAQVPCISAHLHLAEQKPAHAGEG